MEDDFNKVYQTLKKAQADLVKSCQHFDNKITNVSQHQKDGNEKSAEFPVLEESDMEELINDVCMSDFEADDGL